MTKTLRAQRFPYSEEYYSQSPEYFPSIRSLPEKYSVNLDQVRKEALELIENYPRSGYAIPRDRKHPNWNGIGLQTPSGLEDQWDLWTKARSPGKSEGYWPREFTSISSCCPGIIKNFIETFRYPLMAVLLCLESDSKVPAHREFAYHDMAKIHLPIITSPGNEHYFKSQTGAVEKYYMEATGDAYFFDVGKTHWVENRSSSLRVHLVLTLDLKRTWSDENLKPSPSHLDWLIESGKL